MILIAFIYVSFHFQPEPILPFDLLSIPDSHESPFYFANAATKIVNPNHTDPNYTDICYEITREVCDFCCLIDFEFCSRDIGICQPVSDRNLQLILHCIIVFGGIVCGFPVIINCCSCFISYRCCKYYFPVTNGVSCYEFFMRMSCFLVCVRFSDTYKTNQDEMMEEQANKKRGVLYYLFCCFLCPCFFPKNSNSGTSMP